MHAHHGDLDHVAGRPLHRRVHGHALGGVAGHRVVGAQVGQVAPAAQQRHHVAALAPVGQRAVDEGAHQRVRGEVRLDVALRLLLVDLGGLRQPERRDAVEDGVVRALGDRALQRGHLARRHLEHLARRPRVDVLAALERLDDGRLAREVREDAQLDLRVVGGHEPPALLRHEGRPDPPAQLGADRDVHEVRDPGC